MKWTYFPLASRLLMPPPACASSCHEPPAPAASALVVLTQGRRSADLSFCDLVYYAPACAECVGMMAADRAAARGDIV